MPGKRISELTALSGAASANNDDLLIFDSGAGETKRISRSQLAEGMVPDLPLQYYLGVLNANPTQRLNGDALQIGDFYLDAVTKYTTVYDGSGWNSYASVIAAQDAAETARDEAQAARIGAETAETNAETAEANAETAEDGAVAARLAAEAAQIGAELAETNAELARDAAFTNADVYADIATGRAAVADGEQFQVVEGDEIVRYRRDTSSTQTEVARFPSVAKVASAIVPTPSVLVRATPEARLDPAWLPPMEAMVPADAPAPPGWWKTGATMEASDGLRHIISNWSVHHMHPAFWADLNTAMGGVTVGDFIGDKPGFWADLQETI